MFLPVSGRARLTAARAVVVHPRRETGTDVVLLQPGTADYAFATGCSPDGGRHGLFALGRGLTIDGPEADQREPGA